MSPPNPTPPERLYQLEQYSRTHGETLSAHTTSIAQLQREVLVMQTENEYRDQKLGGIYSLGRTVLITVLTLAIGAIFAFFAAGGFSVPPAP